MVAKKLLVDATITACAEQICLLVLYSKFRTEKHWLAKNILLSWKKFAINIWILCFLQLIVFLPAADGPTTTFLGIMYRYFHVIRLVNLVVVALLQTKFLKKKDQT